MAETSKTVDQALALLLALAEEAPLTAAELARRLELNRTIVQRLLSSLHQQGFVIRRERGYVPGAIFVRIADRVQPELRAAAASVMARLGKAVRETVVLHIADRDQAVVIEQYASKDHVVRVEHEIGSRHPLLAGASGRALLAFAAPSAIERVLRKSDGHSELREQLEITRQRGYSLSHDELQQGVYGLAMPVMDREKHPLASLAIIVPTARSAGLMEHLDLLSEAVRDMSDALLG
jgi:DNA-binding IclR family transcriptional regulator